MPLTSTVPQIYPLQNLWARFCSKHMPLWPANTIVKKQIAMLILNQTVNYWCFNEKLDLYPIFLHPKSHVNTYARACTQFHRSKKYQNIQPQKWKTGTKTRENEKRKEKKKKKKKSGTKKRETCLELERERGKNDSALLLKDFADVVAGSGNHRQNNWFPHSLRPFLPPSALRARPSFCFVSRIC